jgi:hypothetical protein
VERCTLRILALSLIACGGEARSASAATVVATPEVIDSLRADLVTLIERDAQKLENVCNASALVTALRVASGDVVVRLREHVRRLVAPALVSGQPDCLVDIAASLVPLVPDTDKRKLIASLASFSEKGIKGSRLYGTVMPSIAPHLTAEESARFARVARAESASSCLRTIILAHLADAGRVPPTEAFTAIQASRNNSCLERDELGVLRLADDATLRAVYPQEMALLDEPPARFGYAHVEALARLAPYLDARRRRSLLVAAFRAMPTVYVDDRNGRGHDWGELPPQFHFWGAMIRLAPLVDGGLADTALRAIPRVWSPAERALAAASLAVELPSAVRRAHLRSFLNAIPRTQTLAACSARLLLAAELSPADAGAALDCVLRQDKEPWHPAARIARALRALPPASQAAFAARIRADVAAGTTSDSRVSHAASVIEALDGARRW